MDAATGAPLDGLGGNPPPRKTRHIYVGLETVEEYAIDEGPTEDTATLLREFVWGDPRSFPDPVAMITHNLGAEFCEPGSGGECVFHYLHDALGSVVGLTDAGSPGDEYANPPVPATPAKLVERYSYDPYGRTFIERWDPAADGGAGGWVESLCAGGAMSYSAHGNPFMWTGQRYDAAVGQYGFWFRMYSPALGRWLQRDPIGYAAGSINLYEYVLGNPVGWVDPLGLEGSDPNAGGAKGGECDTKDRLKKEKEIDVVEATWGGQKCTLIHFYDGHRYLGTIVCPRPADHEGTEAAADYERCLQAALKFAQNHTFMEAARKASGGAYAAGYFIIIAGSLAIPGPDDIILAGAGAAAGAVKAAGLIGKAAKALGKGEKALKEAEKLEDALSAASKIAKATEVAKEGKKSFKSFDALKKALGSAGEGKAWHHIVEQSQEARFGTEAINNTENVIAVSREVNTKANALYSSIRRDITGSDTLTVRQWLSTQSYDEAAAFGRKALDNVSKGVWP